MNQLFYGPFRTRQDRRHRKKNSLRKYALRVEGSWYDTFKICFNAKKLRYNALWPLRSLIMVERLNNNGEKGKMKHDCIVIETKQEHVVDIKRKSLKYTHSKSNL
jgi:hypothetical protein